MPNLLFKEYVDRMESESLLAKAQLEALRRVADSSVRTPAVNRGEDNEIDISWEREDGVVLMLSVSPEGELSYVELDIEAWSTKTVPVTSLSEVLDRVS